MDVGFDYRRRARGWRGGVDRQARGELGGFRRWRTRYEPVVDSAVAAHGVAGNAGGRDFFTGVQELPGVMLSWRLTVTDTHCMLASRMSRPAPRSKRSPGPSWAASSGRS